MNRLKHHYIDIESLKVKTRLTSKHNEAYIHLLKIFNSFAAPALFSISKYDPEPPKAFTSTPFNKCIYKINS